MEFFEYVSLEKARALIADSLNGCMTGSETVRLSNALGRVAAENILAQEDLPPFTRSTVDGFAVRSCDTFGASETAPALFEIIGEVVMGEATTLELLPGQAVVIPTGAMLPAGADAVVMIEHTEQPDTDTLLILRSAPPGENLVFKGEDLRSGDIVVQTGEKLKPQHLGALAACGCSSLLVRKRPTVGVISTGDELADIDEPLGFGQIRDINSYAVGAMLEDMGCNVARFGIVRDSYQNLLDVLANAISNCELVVISGGSSVGTRDYTVKAIGALGTPGVLFHGVAIKPGKPTIFGIIRNVPIFGLPGHPAAAMTVCEQLVKPAVRKLYGQDEKVKPYVIQAQFVRSFASAPGRDDFVNVRIAKNADKITAEPILGKSGLISIMVQTNGVVHIPSEKSGLYSDEMVEVILMKDAD
ncbi:molybdopterin molybdotransferase MoeA [Dendrosporobacter sp. 1207_IL3150]|uniref:molybdopterin molybdotransferase MoeA n=1 Tax=Dendrosporobacter sp. 1207_IL3150 TaxID=3084054 RepID=UPI002FDB2523